MRQIFYNCNLRSRYVRQSAMRAAEYQNRILLSEGGQGNGTKIENIYFFDLGILIKA